MVHEGSLKRYFIYELDIDSYRGSLILGMDLHNMTIFELGKGPYDIHEAYRTHMTKGYVDSLHMTLRYEF